jgi:hypothetical protein
MQQVSKRTIGSISTSMLSSETREERQVQQLSVIETLHLELVSLIQTGEVSTLSIRKHLH